MVRWHGVAFPIGRKGDGIVVAMKGSDSRDFDSETAIWDCRALILLKSRRPGEDMA
jgi:hypothetical protein